MSPNTFSALRNWSLFDWMETNYRQVAGDNVARLTAQEMSHLCTVVDITFSLRYEELVQAVRREVAPPVVWRATVRGAWGVGARGEYRW